MNKRTNYLIDNTKHTFQPPSYSQASTVRIRPKTKEYVVAKFEYNAKEEDELNLQRGSVIEVRSFVSSCTCFN